MISVDDEKYNAFCELCHQLGALSYKLSKARDKKDQYSIAKYAYQIQATVTGMRRISEDTNNI